MDQTTAVECATCFQDHTESNAVGGLVMGAFVVCPACAPMVEEGAKKHRETAHITHRAEDGERFRDFVRRVRAEHAKT
jgi:hypothetical protein